MATATKTRIPKPAVNGEHEADPSGMQSVTGEMTTLRVRFIGITPLIQHSTRGMDLGWDSGDESVKKTAKKSKTKEAVCEEGTYPIGDGTYYHPGESFRSAAIDAVTGTKIGKQSAPALLMSSFFVVTERPILIDSKNGKPLTKYGTDERYGRNPSTGGAVLCVRPIWQEWACEVEFEYDAAFIHEKSILQSLALAGVKVGIGILRPMPSKKNKNRGKGGRYGKFRVEIVK